MKKKILPFFIAAGGYGVLAALLFSQLLFQGKIPAAPDSLIPQASSMALERLQDATGLYPLWQPWVFSGMPTVEAFSFLSGLYYPNALFSLFTQDGIALELLHLVFAGLGLSLLLRELGVTKFASFFGGAVFMLNPYMTAMLVHGHGSQLMTAAYMPWMLWATKRLIERGGWTEAGTLALLAGFQLQRSHVQIAYYTWMLALLFALFMLFGRRSEPKRVLRPAGLLVVALLCGAAMSASIYLPASQYAPWSVRGMASQGTGSSWEYATLWSMHPVELLTFLVPGAFGFGGLTYWGHMPFTDFPHYAGSVVLLLAVAGAALTRREPMTRYLLAALSLSLLLSFGRFFTPVFDLFYHAVPLFSRFRVPSMALVMAYLILALLAAQGVDALLQSRMERTVKPLGIAAAVLTVLTLLFAVFSAILESFFRSLFPAPPVESFDVAYMINTVRWENLQGSLFTVAPLALLSIALLMLAVKRLLPLRVSAWLLFLLAVGDLVWSDLQIISPSASSLRSPVLADRAAVDGAFRPDDITRFLASRKGQFRIYPAGALFTENKFALFGIESAGGYHPAKLKIYEEFLAATGNLANLNILRMLNVAYIVSPEPLRHPELLLVKTGILQLATAPQPVWVYHLQGTLPRAWFADKVTGVKSDGELFGRLLGEHTPAGEVYVGDSLWSATRTFSAASVTSLDAGAESMRLKVSVPGDAFLVVSEIYYPLRWKVEIDGRAASMLKVNGLLRGVVLPQGSREVRFYYDRSLFETGRMISFGAFAAALLMLAGGMIAGRFRGSSLLTKRSET